MNVCMHYTTAHGMTTTHGFVRSTLYGQAFFFFAYDTRIHSLAQPIHKSSNRG